MSRMQSADLTEIFKAYQRRDWLDLYLSDGTAKNLSRGVVNRNSVDYDNWIASVEDLNSSIDTAVDRITINCQNVNSLLGFNVASNLRLLDYALADYGKIYQSLRNPALRVDLDTFRGVLANASADEQRISFELIVDYESLGSIVAGRGLSPRCWWAYKNGIECTSTSSLLDCTKTRAACIERGKPWEFGGWEFFEEASSDLPGAGGNDDGGLGVPCFTGETLVWTPDGDVPIGEMKARFERGRKSVFSFNPDTGEITEDEILEVFEHQIKGYFTFFFEHGSVNVTPKHPFLVEFGRFKTADKFARNDTTKIYESAWSDSKLKAIKWNSEAVETVWNIKVRENQAYFAGGCAVHNTKSIGENQSRPQLSGVDGAKTKIQLKYSLTGDTPDDLATGEPEYSENGDILFIGLADGTAKEIGGAGAFLARTEQITTTANLSDSTDKRFVNETEKYTLETLPTTLDSYQKITTIGTEWLNLRAMSSFPIAIGATDITQAINDALNLFAGRSIKNGRILIPRGAWTTNGGHILTTSVMVAGDAHSLANDGITRGSGLTLATTAYNNYIFSIQGDTQNVVIRDLMLDASVSQSAAIGLWIYGTTGNYHVKTTLNNVFFRGGRYGIKNESASDTHFQNDGFSAFDCAFQDCRSAFWNNSINGSFYFWKPVIFLPTIQSGFSTGGTAFDLGVVGTLVVEKYHIVGTGAYDAYGQVTDESVLLRTAGQCNKIVFKEGQDERLKDFYRNDTSYHYPGDPIVLINNSIQSQFYSFANVAFEIDSNYFTNQVGFPNFFDTPYGSMRIIKKGQNFVETRLHQSTVVISGTSETGNSALTYLQNPQSQVIDLRGEIRSPNSTSAGDALQDYGGKYNKPYRMPAGTYILNGNTKTINATSGVVNLEAGVVSFSIYNNTMYYNSADDCSIVDVWLEGASSNVFVDTVVPNIVGGYTYFTVNLTATTDDVRKLYFKVR